MPGPKKPTLKQMEKRMARQRRQEKPSSSEKHVGEIIPPSLEEVEAFVKTQPYITPYVLSERFGIRLSIAKSLLSSLAERRVIRLVQGDSRLRIYAPVERVVEEKAEAKAKAKPAKDRKRRK